jgi:hypothetical protein
MNLAKARNPREYERLASEIETVHNEFNKAFESTRDRLRAATPFRGSKNKAEREWAQKSSDRAMADPAVSGKWKKVQAANAAFEKFVRSA